MAWTYLVDAKVGAAFELFAGATQITSDATRDKWWPRYYTNGNGTPTTLIYCSTPAGVHDTSPSAFQQMTVHQISLTGTGDIQRLGLPSTINATWDRYGHPEISPDGTRMAVFVQTTAGAAAIVEFAVSTWTTGRIAYLSTAGNACTDPSYSPDGTKIVFTESVGGVQKVSTVATNSAFNLATGNGYTVLVTGNPNGFPWNDPYYTPDGTKIVLLSQRVAADSLHQAGQWDNYVVASSGGTPTRITPGDGPIYGRVIPGDNTKALLHWTPYNSSGVPAGPFKIGQVMLDGSGFTDLNVIGEYPGPLQTQSIAIGGTGAARQEATSISVTAGWNPGTFQPPALVDGRNVASFVGTGQSIVVTANVGTLANGIARVTRDGSGTASVTPLNNNILTTYTGPRQIPAGTYDRFIFGPGIGNQVNVGDGVIITNSVFILSGQDTGNPGLNINPSGVGPCSISDCEITALSTPPGGDSSCDRMIGVNGNGAFILQRNWIHDSQRGLYMATHGLDNTQRRQILFNMFGNFYSNTPAGNHTSSVGHGNGAHAYWVDLIGNCMLNIVNGNVSGCFQWYPESGGDAPPHHNADPAFWAVQKNYFAGTNGQVMNTLGYSIVGDPGFSGTLTNGGSESPHNNCIVSDNFVGVLWDGTNPSVGGGAFSSRHGPFVAGAIDQAPERQPGVLLNNTWSNNRWYAPGLAKDGTLIPAPTG